MRRIGLHLGGDLGTAFSALLAVVVLSRCAFGPPVEAGHCQIIGISSQGGGTLYSKMRVASGDRVCGIVWSQSANGVSPGNRVTVATPPEHGKALPQASRPGVNYYPDPGYVGPDRFSVAGLQGASIACVDVDVLPRSNLSTTAENGSVPVATSTTPGSGAGGVGQQTGTRIGADWVSLSSRGHRAVLLDWRGDYMVGR